MEYADKNKAAQSLAEAPQREAATGNPVAVTGIHNSPRMVAQRRLLRSLFGDAVQLKEEDSNTSSTVPVQREAAAPEATNRTGLPDGLKAGIESLSGVSLDPVEVHYNSPQPAQLNALAYAQGTHIHVAPGQEQHLPHEAWHVVQQAQGRVQPTAQLAQGVSVNTDQALEQEADVMGAQALQMRHAGPTPTESTTHPSAAATPIQRVKILGKLGVIHINDYHFMDRLKLTKGPASGTHAVILRPFDDFAGLARAAHDNHKGDFSFGGYAWGWRGDEEIFPIPDDKNCVNLSAEQIGELATTASSGLKATDFATLKEKGAKPIGSAFNAAKQQSPLPRVLTLPIETTKGTLSRISGIRFEEGRWWDLAMVEGGTPQAFLMGPHGSKEEGPHLHLFMSCKKKTVADENNHPIVVDSYHMTTSTKKSLRRTPEGIVDKKHERAVSLTEKESAEVLEMEVMCDMINLSHVEPAAAEKVSSSKEEKKKPSGKNYVKESTAAVTGVNKNIIIVAQSVGVRVQVLGHFLQQIALLDPESIENIAGQQHVYGALNEFGFGEEVGYLGDLDAFAAKLGKSENDVISLLDPAGYPTSDFGKYYDGLKGTLKS